MRTLIGLFLVLFFVSSPASAHHSYHEGLELLYNNSLVFGISIILMFSLIVATVTVILFKRISFSKMKSKIL
jgi:hypothetical protein